MNYQHAFHAGGCADVFKHWVLTLILEKLALKATPFGVLDTHAGEGLYDLTGLPAQRTQEYRQGIQKLLSLPDIPTSFHPYLSAVTEAQYGGALHPLRYYPGSPWIIQHHLREQDALIACEKHPYAFEKLKETLAGYPNVALHEQDAYLGLKAFLPLKQKRGLVLIDPPFEEKNELDQICRHLSSALHCFAQGIIMIWYPIKHRPPIQRFHDQLRTLMPHKLLITELLQRDDNDAHQLNGNGLAIINPPYLLDTVLEKDLPWLATQFALGKGARSVIKTP